ncbi:MAG: Gfo/Idh/MocA family oxidoreductase [Phycisphaerales bacterium]|nr:Gfo/Idh/MocA family oxidoreductase [Phycisphaerales bacterium]
MSAHAGDINRRDFVKATAATMVGAGVLGAFSPNARAAHRVAARGRREIRVGVIGCGGRGTGAAGNAIEASPDARIVALGDLFPERITRAQAGLSSFGDRAQVPPAQCFTGFDAYQGVLSVPCDYVILATPPGFRPIHFSAAIAAGRNAFVEKPVAVDPTGIRTMLAAAAEVDAKNLRVAAGTQRRHEWSYLEAMKQVRQGAIGRVVAARVFWNMGTLWSVAPDPARSDVENQVRNWLYHTWLSGDHIVEQHVHNIDIANWAMGTHPVRCVAVGGRQVRTDINEFGHIFDHFAVDFEYPPVEGDDSPRFALSMARQQDGTAGRVEEVIYGSKGVLRLSPGSARITGETDWMFKGPNNNPYVQEHIDLQNAIVNGTPLNETAQVAASTMCAIMGRMAAYSGSELTWDDALAHPMNLMPPSLQFGPLQQAPVAMPGKSASQLSS